MNKKTAIHIGKVKIFAIERFVPRYAPSIPQQAILSNQTLGKAPTELQYVERSVFVEKSKNLKLMDFRIKDS